MFTFFNKKFNKTGRRGFFKTPFFGFRPQGFKGGNLYFGLVAFVLLGLLFNWSDSLAQANYTQGSELVFFNSFFENTANASNNDLFFGQNKELALETPDLKISDNSISAVSTPTILTTQTLGDIFGGSDEERDGVTDYTVQIGDTVDSVTKMFGFSSTKTILNANELSAGATLKVGQTLTILPVDGLLHVVKNGDTISQIANMYKAKVDDIIAFNNLVSEGDIFVGDILIIPGGVLPPKAAPHQINTQIPLPGSTFISPFGAAKFRVTQGLHYFNAVDIQSLAGAGSPIYAMAAGLVQRAGFDRVGGNRVTILHSNGVVTYYGHLSAMLVKPGDQVYMGQQIGTEGRTGVATGPHVHLEVIGARNPYAGIEPGTVLGGK